MKKLIFLFVFVGINFAYGQKFNWVKPQVECLNNNDYFEIGGVAVDSDNNSYSLVGYEDDLTIDGNTVSLLDGIFDVVIIKYDSNGVYQWAVPFGINDGESPAGIVVDDNNDVMVLYGTWGEPTNFPDTTVAYQSEIQIAKFDSDGNFLKIIPLSSMCDVPHYLHQAFDAYLSSIYYAGCEDDSVSVYKIDASGIESVLLTVYDTALNSSANINEMNCAANGDVLIKGTFTGTIRIGPYTLVDYPGGGPSSSFIARIDTTGNVIWAERFKYSSEFTTAFRGDVFGNTYLWTEADWSNFSFGNFNYSVPFEYKGQSIIMKLNPNGNIIWYKTIFSKQGNWPGDLHINSNSEIIAVGRNWDQELLPYIPGSIRQYQNFILKLDSSGNEIYTTVFNDFHPTNGSLTLISTNDDVNYYMIGDKQVHTTDFGCLRSDPSEGIFFIASWKDTAKVIPSVNFDYYIDNNEVFFTNQNINYDSLEWNFGDGTKSKQINPSHVYSTFGSFTVSLTIYGPCGFNYLSRELEIYGIQSISPDSSGNSGLYYREIYGVGFTMGTTVSLTKSGYPEIEADSVIYFDSTHLRAIFNFDSAAVGLWNVQVNIPGYGIRSLNDAYRMDTLRVFDSWVKVKTPRWAFLNINSTVSIQVGNNGNEVGYGVLVFVGFSGPCTVSLRSIVNESTFTQSVLDSTSDLHFYISKDSLTGDSTWVGGFMIPKLEGGEVVTLYINLSTVPNAQARLIKTYAKVLSSAYLTADDLLPAHQRNLNRSIGDFIDPCMDCMGDIAEFIPYVSCAKLLGSTFFNWDELMGGTENETKQVYDIAEIFISMFQDCGLSTAGGLKFVTEFLDKYIFNPGDFLSALGSCGNCIEELQDIGNELIPPSDDGSGPDSGSGSGSGSGGGSDNSDEGSTGTGISLDPNIKEGFSDVSNENFVNKNKDLVYDIYFENDITATAAARFVTVTDQLDTSKFDLSSFYFTGFTLGDSTLESDLSCKRLVRDYDLRPETNCILRVSFDIDDSTGLITWYFESLNTETYDLIDNPFDGFLPPNVNYPDGQASIQFRVKLKDGLVHETIIENDAIIVFDANAPITTPLWINTIDDDRPSSFVLPLPQITTDTNFVVKWTGVDDDSGIRDFSIYVSDNDTVYRIWIWNTKVDSAVYQGKQGVRYKFLCIARDYVGNVELYAEKPLINPDAFTTVDTTRIIFYVDADNDGYGDVAGQILAFEAPPGYVNNNSDCNDTDSNINPGETELCNTIDDNCDGSTDESCRVQLNVNVYIEGYYIMDGVMRAVIDAGVFPSACDTLVLQLVQPVSPYDVLFADSSILSTSGSAQFDFDPVVSGNSYYYVLRHRNTVETWSNVSVNILGFNNTYDFTDAMGKAYGDNLKDLGDGRFAIYSGDVNQDGAVDGADFLLLDASIQLGDGGYKVGDMNGDGAVDGGDFLLLDPNIQNGIGIIVP